MTRAQRQRDAEDRADVHGSEGTLGPVTPAVAGRRLHAAERATTEASIPPTSLATEPIEADAVDGDHGPDPTQRRVLILNASFEPFHVCTVRRAIHLLMTAVAVRVEDANAVLRTPTRTVPVPSIVRLARYVRRPHAATVAFNRRNLFRRDEHRCQYCGRSDGHLTIDHVLPRSRGGRTTWSNVVACCTVCNARKRDRTPLEAGMVLAAPPRPPAAKFAVTYGLTADVDPRWAPYLGR